MKGRKVLINVMYSVCSNVCPPATRNLIEARRLLGDAAKDVHFVSMTLTPLADTPEALRSYKKLHGIGANWTVLTGTLDNVETAQRALGFIGVDDTDDLLSHSAMAKLCDERNLRWSHVNTMLSARSIARMIRFELV
jgi:protein SCO1